MAETLVMLEFEDEALAYVDSCAMDSASSDQIRVIALSLAAQLVLKANSIPYQNTLPYFDNQAHARALIRSEEWLQLIESHTDLNDALRAELSFCIRPVLNYLLWLAEIIAQADEAERPATLCGPHGRVPDRDLEWKLTSQDRPLGFLMQEYAAQRGLRYEAFSTSAARQEQPHTNRTATTSNPRFRAVVASRLLAQLVRWLTTSRQAVLLAADSYGLGRAARQLDDDLPGVTYMVLDPSPSAGSSRHLLALLRALFRKTVKQTESPPLVRLPVWVFPYDRRQAGRQAKEVNDSLEELASQIEGTWRERFEHRNLDLAPHIARKLRGGIKHHLVGLSQAQGPLRAALETVRPGLVLSPYCAGVYNLLGDICRELDIPAVMVTHGTHVPPRNRSEEIEQWRLSQSLMLAPTYQYTVAQSPWAARHADYFGASERTFNTGPILFARTDSSRGQQLRRQLGIARDTSVIVYAVTQKTRSSVRFHVFETDDEYLTDMADLVLAVNQMESAHLVLKLHPSADFSEADMRSLLPPCERMSVLHREPFAEVLSAADLLVSYSSTTIEEALLNRIPVVLYDRWSRYCHIEALDCNAGDPEHWPADAAYYVSESSRLPQVLEHALRNAATARHDDHLYARHLFQIGEARPLSHYVRDLMVNYFVANREKNN